MPLADNTAIAERLRRDGDEREVLARPIDRLAYAHDASHYLLVPDAVAVPRDAADVARLMALAAEARTPLTFRSGGTSLSGQAQSAALMADTRKNFRAIEVLDGGARVRVQPGATVRQVNARLARYGRKLGPDPASEAACTIGGVIADNSSGMSSGIEANSYRTIESMTFVLPGGTVIDTADADADARLLAAEPELHGGLVRLRRGIHGSPALVAEIRRQFAMKNTMGYGVNAFLDFERPVDVLAHLLIGSEGTLGFVAEAVFRTVPDHPRSATGLLVFPDLGEAMAALTDLVGVGFAAIELMDAASLRVAGGQTDAPAQLRTLQVRDHAALLVEHQAPDDEALAELLGASDALLSRLPLTMPATLTSDPAVRASLWHTRKGLYATVAEARPSGTSALLEDVAVPVPVLGRACSELSGLFDAHGYGDSVIFGHAKDGNIHFMLTEHFGDPASLARYERFTDDMVDLILGLGGALKAEHGTGRVMAPFVRRQFGDELYEVMREVKRLADPAGILNPGVIFAEDPRAYVLDLKSAPTVEEEVDRCVECGYCEPVCPSRDLTLTPRQRIVLRREIERAELSGDAELAASLRRDYDYDGVQTCAVDGMCSTACPVVINTGDLVRRLRQENRGRLADAGWNAAAHGWSAATRVGGVALSGAAALPTALPAAATTVGRRLLGADTVPEYSAELPRGGTPRRAGTTGAGEPQAVYFSSCISTMFGPGGEGPGVRSALLELCERAGVTVVMPEGIGSLCCGTPWKSKGMSSGYATMSDRVRRTLRSAGDGGRLPIVCDAVSCSEGLEVMLELAGEPGLRVVDAVDFVVENVLPRLTVTAPIASIAVHPTCSSTQLGVTDGIVAIARAISADVVVPEAWGCCAFAGDRGMLHPELTASATRAEAAELAEREFAAYASANRTCELGMSRATGQEFQHILELLEQATR